MTEDILQPFFFVAQHHPKVHSFALKGRKKKFIFFK